MGIKQSLIFKWLYNEGKLLQSDYFKGNIQLEHSVLLSINTNNLVMLGCNCWGGFLDARGERQAGHAGSMSGY